mgnify:CR=1 FL=1
MEEIPCIAWSLRRAKLFGSTNIHVQKRLNFLMAGVAPLQPLQMEYFIYAVMKEISMHWMQKTGQFFGLKI